MKYYKNDYIMVKAGRFYNVLYKGTSIWTGYKNNQNLTDEEFMVHLINEYDLSDKKKKEITDNLEIQKNNFKIISEIWKQIPQNMEWGSKIKIVCPICKGKMIVSRVANNGHYHIKCIDNKCFSIMQ